MQIEESFKDVKTELNMHVGNALIFNGLSIIIGNSFNRPILFIWINFNR